jgi:hypothetical protein
MRISLWKKALAAGLAALCVYAFVPDGDRGEVCNRVGAASVSAVKVLDTIILGPTKLAQLV